MDDAPEDLVGVVGGDGKPDQVVGMDRVPDRGGGRVAAGHVAERDPVRGRRGGSDDQPAGLVRGLGARLGDDRVGDLARQEDHGRPGVAQPGIALAPPSGRAVAPNDGTASGAPASRASRAASEQTGQAGSRRSVSSVNSVSRASNRSSRPASVSPIPSSSFRISFAWRRPMMPGTTPSTPATEHPGASSGGGGTG